jgi:trimeric autotransporter adhesin
MSALRQSLTRLLLLSAALGALCVHAPAQADGDTRGAAATTLSGVVIASDGSPEAGAIVVTSAGGRAATAEDGSFELTLALPAGADGVQVTALAGAGGSSRSASAHVAGLVPGGSARLPPLALASTSGCQPAWLPTFGGAPGVSDSVRCFGVFDDGSGGGPALYIGGIFTSAGGVVADRIARWDGAAWSAVGGGVAGPASTFVSVLALEVFDDGNGGGPALYAGGSFTSAGGVPALGIARWDGASWSAVGGGMGVTTLSGGVFALRVFDDGSGPALYAGGAFTIAGGLTARRVARWNGSAWSPLGTGMSGEFASSGSVSALAAFDDGGGPALFAAGNFTKADDAPANRIAKWNGTAWSPLGSGLEGPQFSSPDGSELVVFDDGSGSALYVGGHFKTAGGLTVNNLARWSGSNWSGLAGGVLEPAPDTTSAVGSLASFDDGSGPALYVGGHFQTAGGVPAQNVARWNGGSWSSLGAGLSTDGTQGASAMLIHDDGNGPRLFVGGTFAAAGDAPAAQVASWSASGWTSVGDSGLNGSVRATVAFDDGSGPALFVGGLFPHAGGTLVNHVSKWDGQRWSALGSGTNGDVNALAVYDDGNGPALYAGGSFTEAGGVPASNFARWDGTSWSPEVPIDVVVTCMAVCDDGSGPALFVGSSSTIQKWDGTSWQYLGFVSFSGSIFSHVYALASFDDGSGTALYAGGSFNTVEGVPARGIARWDGASWSPVGSGMGGAIEPYVQSLAVFDDGLGSGPQLHAGGYFFTAGGVPASCMARWNGSSWSALGTGVDHLVAALTIHDDGSGAALIAGGGFGTAGGQTASHLARWDGTNWSALGGATTGYVAALASIDDGSGSGAALVAGGSFGASEGGDSYLARRACPSPPSAWTSLGVALEGVDGLPHLSGTGTLLAGTPASITLAHAAPSAATVLFASLANHPTAFKGGLLVPVPAALTLPLMTGPTGAIPIPIATWPAGLSGLDVFFQYAIQDAAAIHGVALSNALHGDVP